MVAHSHLVVVVVAVVGSLVVGRHHSHLGPVVLLGSLLALVVLRDSLPALVVLRDSLLELEELLGSLLELGALPDILPAAVPVAEHKLPKVILRY